MRYKNIEIHNVAELTPFEDGSVSWKRVPSQVHAAMASANRDNIVCCATGVELRFVIKGESARVVMSTLEDNPNGFATFHVYRGGIQGGWSDHEVHCHVTGKPQEFVIERSENMDNLRTMTRMTGLDWDPEVVRVVFDRGRYKIYDVLGDVAPPEKEQCPQKTLLCYGSSITHGSNAIDMSHTWASLLGYNLNMDVRNLGMAGSCCLEPEMAEYIAQEGENGGWDVATLELGINVLGWEEPKIYDRVENMLRQVAGRNPDKPIFVISPFYYGNEDLRGSTHGAKWRRIIAEVAQKLAYPNVHYINGLDILGDISGMSADEIHPNIYGVQQIADRLTAHVKKVLDL